MTNAAGSLATFDSFAGVELELGGRAVVVPALTFADGLRLMRLAERANAGDEEAARSIVALFPRAIGLELEDLGDDFAGVFERMFDWSQYSGRPEPAEEDAAPSGTRDAEPVRITFDDLLADYAAYYRGLPRPDDPWPLVLALLQRMPRFESRARLRLLDSVGAAIAAVIGGDWHARRHREELLETAYPAAQKRLEFRPNILHPDYKPPNEDPNNPEPTT